MKTMTKQQFADWYCQSCNEWSNQRGDDHHVYHDLVTMDRTPELVNVAKRWRKAREQERALALQLYELIQAAHKMGLPETRIAELAGVDRMTVRRALGKR